MRGKLRRFLLITAGVLVLLPFCGALYQAWCVHREATQFPPPGRLVDIGGRRLHLLCIGKGEPAVVFEGGAFQGSVSEEAVRTEVSLQTQVCSYDRAGMGWSDPAPRGAISAGQMADDLRLLLERAEIRPPYILVPSSLGGLTVEMFARRYPDRVAGLVFVDAGYSAILERGLATLGAQYPQRVCLARWAARLGVLRLLDPFHLRNFPPAQSAQAAQGIALLYRAEPMDTLCAIARGLPQSAQDFRDAPPLPPGVPLVVLSHDNSSGFIPPGIGFLARDSRFTSLMEQWTPLEEQLSKRSRRGTFRIVPGSNHMIANTQPHVVATAILEMLSQLRQQSGQ